MGNAAVASQHDKNINREGIENLLRQQEEMRLEKAIDLYEEAEELTREAEELLERGKIKEASTQVREAQFRLKRLKESLSISSRPLPASLRDLIDYNKSVTDKLIGKGANPKGFIIKSLDIGSGSIPFEGKLVTGRVNRLIEDVKYELEDALFDYSKKSGHVGLLVEGYAQRTKYAFEVAEDGRVYVIEIASGNRIPRQRLPQNIRDLIDELEYLSKDRAILRNIFRTRSVEELSRAAKKSSFINWAKKFRKYIR